MSDVRGEFARGGWPEPDHFKRSLLISSQAIHYLTPETKLTAPATVCADQPLALERAGFVDVQRCHGEGNMALWCGTNPVAAGMNR